MDTDQRMDHHLSLKLLVDQKSNTVLFAEAGKDVVDFLFGLMTMPLGSIIRLLSTKRMVGCIGNIYHSVNSLDSTYIQSQQNREVLLRPKVQSPPPSKNTLLLEADASSTAPAKKYFRCSPSFGRHDNRGIACGYFTDGSGIPCPSCKQVMTSQIAYVDPNAGKVVSDGGGTDGGYVKGVVTYMVMDDLTVTPLSTISSITLLNKLRVTDVCSLEERMVELGMEEGLELLKASLESTTALTDVFLGKKKVSVE